MTNTTESDKSGLEKLVLKLVETVSAQSAEIRTLCEIVEQLRQELQMVTKTPTRKKTLNQPDKPLLIIERAQSETSSASILTPDEIRTIRESHKLSVKDAAEKVGVKPSAWYGWEDAKQQRRPSKSAAKLITMLRDGTL